MTIGHDGGMALLSQRLTERGLPSVEAQAAHPTVAGIARGDLDPAVFRCWLEQDYLFLLDYVRVFSRLAWQAPDGHLGDLVDLAHATWHEELGLYVLCGDNGRYFNHSDAPNTVSSGISFGDDRALRDLAIGEELTSDYRTICDHVRRNGEVFCTPAVQAAAE